MVRVLIFLGIVFALGVGFAWLAERPGDLVVTFNGYEYQLTIMVAAVIIVALVAAVMLTWWLIKSIWNSPHTVRRFFRARRRDRGYQALSTGLIATGAGDSGLARRMSKQASSHLSTDHEPLLYLLDAQTLLLEGRHEDARKKFEQMLDDPETRLLGLRGLYLEAKRHDEHEAARQYAEEAAAAAPQLIWAANATIGAKVLDEDFDGALGIVSSQAATRQITRAEADSRRAVLLTAKALALIDTDPSSARSAALEANKLAPDFVPAAVAAGRVLFRHDELRKGIKILESAWKKNPHPEIASAYIHARSGDSTHDRLKRAKRLQSLKRNHVESALAVARASLDAGEFGQARQEAEAALRLEPREGTYLLMADIEEAETADQGRVRYWLSKAVRAPRDPAWTADGYVSEHWAPISPVTGTIGAFEWRVPVERLGEVIDVEEAEEAREISLLPQRQAPEPPIAPDEDETPTRPATEQKALEPGEEAATENAGEPIREPAVKDLEPVARATATAGKPGDGEEEKVSEAEASGEPVPTGEPEKKAKRETVVAEIDSRTPPIPDDPGVDETDEEERARAFRLF